MKRTKTIKGNKMVIADGMITYISRDGFKITRGVSHYDGLGQHIILEAVFNFADNNIEGYELMARFEAWMKGEKEPKIGNFSHPYTCYQY